MFPRIDDGRLLLYRMLDVADDIDLERAEEALRAAPAGARLADEPPGFRVGPDRPISLLLGRRSLRLAGGPLDADAHARIFAHGVVSLRYEVPLPPGSGADEVVALLRRAHEGDLLEQEARREAAAVLAHIGAAAQAPHEEATVETYAVVFATAIDPQVTADAVQGEDLARVLLAEAPGTRLSDQTVAHATRHRFGYGRADLCVLDWDVAFVLEPSGDRSVPDVLEVAGTQLLELRHYDAVFEREILRVTDELVGPGRPLAWRRARETRALARRVQALVLESAEVVERAENAVRFAGDLYLARVHRAAVERFRIAVWQASVERRQETMADVAGLLHSDASAQLGHALEGMILLLIVLEIVLALLRAL